MGRLILTRRLSEKIIIEKGIKLEKDITIVILGVNGNQVKIGLEATNDVKIYREEIYQKIKKRQKNEETS